MNHAKITTSSKTFSATAMFYLILLLPKTVTNNCEGKENLCLLNAINSLRSKTYQEITSAHISSSF